MPVSTRVPNLRRQVSMRDIKVSLDISQRHWVQLGELANYLRGRGSVLIPAHAPEATVAGGATDTFRYRVAPSGRAIARVWYVEIASTSPTALARATVSVTGSSADMSTIAATPVMLIETPVAKGTAEVELVLTVQNTGTQTLRIDSVLSWELHRAQLTKDATDVGVDLGSLEFNRPICDRDYEAIAGVADAVAATNGRRCGLISWRGPDASFTNVAFSGTDVVFDLAIPIVPPKIAAANTTRTCDWNVYAYCSDGTTAGEIRVIDAAGGTSSVLSVVAGTTTPTWFTGGTKSLLCEDLSTTDGLQGGSYETVNVQVRRTAGAGSVKVRGFNVYDGPSTW